MTYTKIRNSNDEQTHQHPAQQNTYAMTRTERNRIGRNMKYVKKRRSSPACHQAENEQR